MRIPENFRYYLSMHAGCNESLLARAGSFEPLDIELSINPDAVRQKRMVYAVIGEIHRMKAFVRLKAIGNRILCGYLKPRHKIGAYITDHFARRNPGIIVVLGNGTESWISLLLEGKITQDHGRGMAESLDRLRSAFECMDEGQDLEKLWQVYYDSQFCPERKNPSSFHQKMPKKDQNAAELRLGQNKKGVTLDDFLGKA